MKAFTIILILSILSVPAFAGGSGDKDAMDDKPMEKAEPMEAEPMEKSMPTMELIPPFEDFMDLDSAAMKAASAPTVLYFYASWCPSCKAAAKELKADPEKLDGINLLVVDYDDSDDLQEKYGVTYQHTFVIIDTDGEALDVWNGGGIDDILMHVGDM